MRVKIYEYEKCSTCRNALKFLDRKKVSYEKVAITEQPPSAKELKTMLSLLQGEVKKLFNTSGQVYREMKLGKKLPKLSPEEAIRLLASNGKLVKRPFLLIEGSGNAGTQGAVGFKENKWKALFKS